MKVFDTCEDIDNEVQDSILSGKDSHVYESVMGYKNRIR